MSQEEQRTTTTPPSAVPQEELWREIFKQTVEALRMNAAHKKTIIRNCCTLLEQKGMPLEMICGRVMKELADFASAKYFFDTIEQKYKDSRKIRAYNHRQPGEDLQREQQQESVHLRSANEQKNVVEQKQTEQEDHIIWQIPVADYKIADLEQYDKAFLVKLVIYLHNKVENLEAAQQQKGV